MKRVTLDGVQLPSLFASPALVIHWKVEVPGRTSAVTILVLGPSIFSFRVALPLPVPDTISTVVSRMNGSGIFSIL